MVSREKFDELTAIHHIKSFHYQNFCAMWYTIWLALYQNHTQNLERETFHGLIIIIRYIFVFLAVNNIVL